MFKRFLFYWKKNCYGMEGKFKFNQNFEEPSSKLIDIIIMKLIYKKRKGRSFRKNLFCSLCNQVVVILPMDSLFLPKDHLAKVCTLVKNIFFSCKVSYIYV